MAPLVSDVLCRAALERLNVGVMLLDAEHRITLWNGFMAKHSEVPEEEILGRNLFDAFPYLSRGLLELKFKSLRMLRNYSFTSWKQRPYFLRFRNSRPMTGGLDYMAQDCTFMPVFDGEAFFICVTIQDMSEVALAQRTLEEAQDMNQMLQNMSSMDGLTGVLNRFHIEQSLQREFDRATRYGSAFSVAMVDLDNFKKVNDTHGHLAGDEVLRAVAREIQGHLRAADLFGRFGGEEFLLVLAETNGSGGMALAERLRRAVETMTITHDGHALPVTMSIGVVEPRPSVKDSLQMIYLADIALYEAKKQGRNRAVLHTTTGTAG